MSGPPEWVNAEQAAGEHRIRHAALFDAEVRPHGERFRAAARVGLRGRVMNQPVAVMVSIFGGTKGRCETNQRC